MAPHITQTAVMVNSSGMVPQSTMVRAVHAVDDLLAEVTLPQSQIVEDDLRRFWRSVSSAHSETQLPAAHGNGIDLIRYGVPTN